MFGVRCPGCGRQRWWPCPACCAALVPVVVPPVPGVDSVAALFAHDGVGRAVVAATKYRPSGTGRRWVAGGLAGLVGVDRRPDIVTWVPASRARRRDLGFDPGALLARGVAARLGVPARSTLDRGADRPQSVRTRAQRGVGPALTARCDLRGATVVVLDDVITTGSSLRVAAAELRSAGAVRVDAVAMAHRPGHAVRAVDSIRRTLIGS